MNYNNYQKIYNEIKLTKNELDLCFETPNPAASIEMLKSKKTLEYMKINHID